MKKELEIYILKYFVLIIIFFSLIKSTDFLRKIYFLGKYDYTQRIGRSYNFCKDGSVPFLYFLKDKYRLSKKVKIIDYDINPNPEWVLFNLDNENVYKNKLILLNYRKQAQLQFIKLKDNIFVTHIKPPYLFTIEKVIFPKNVSINKVSLEIFNKAGNVKKILLSKKFVFKNKSNEINLNSDLEKSNIRTGKLFFRISSDENYLNKIEKIDLKIIPNYNLNNFKVLEKNNNCYFLEKLS